MKKQNKGKTEEKRSNRRMEEEKIEKIGERQEVGNKGRK